MIVELVDYMAILVAARRFPGMDVVDSRSLSFDMYSFIALLKFLFGAFGGMCGENLCKVFLLLFTWTGSAIFLVGSDPRVLDFLGSGTSEYL
jgi:hypothetical protein